MKQSKLKIAFLASVLVLTGLPVRPIRAATITVTTTNDVLDAAAGVCANMTPTNVTTTGDGLVSLREAICAANNNAGSDTITLLANTYNLTITGALEDNNATGDLDILDGGDLTIQGNGAGSTIVDGGGSDRVFHICPGGGCDNDVTISRVTIRNGRVTASGGGGIRNEAGTTTLDGSAVIANTAVNGGGIANFAALHIQNGSTIGELGAGNWAYLGSGGGIYNYAGTTTVDGSTVISNTRSTMAAASGTRPR
jgi:hypothetical protein